MEQRMAKKQPTKDDPEQYKRFLEAAKEAEADETEAGADKAFKKIVKPRRQ
jgi:hypothetical protein